jgi:hypothetical protein
MKLIQTESKNINYFKQVIELDRADRVELFNLGLYNQTVNNSYNTKPTIETIEACAFILSKYYGRITKYAIWTCSIAGVRIIFGN